MSRTAVYVTRLRSMIEQLGSSIAADAAEIERLRAGAPVSGAAEALDVVVDIIETIGRTVDAIERERDAERRRLAAELQAERDAVAGAVAKLLALAVSACRATRDPAAAVAAVVELLTDDEHVALASIGAPEAFERLQRERRAAAPGEPPHEQRALGELARATKPGRGKRQAKAEEEKPKPPTIAEQLRRAGHSTGWSSRI